MKTQSAKAKGRKLQQYVSRRIKDILKLEEDDVVSRPMGSSGVDILLSPLAQKKIKTSFECKNTVGAPTYKDYEQALKNTYPNTSPAIVWKPKGKPYNKSLVTLSLDDYLKLHTTE